GALLDQLGACAFERGHVSALQPRDFAVLVVDQRRPMENRFRHRPAVAGRINKIVGKTRGIKEKLLRHAAADHAGTADAVFFRDHDARAVLARNARGAHATRSRTNDEKVEVVVGHRRLLTLDDADAARAGENSGLRQTDEQPVLYNTGNAAKLRGQRLRIGNALERGIKDPVAAVSADDVAFL